MIQCVFFLLGAAIGWMSWTPPLHLAVLWLLPVLWSICPRERDCGGMMFGYYLAATALIWPSMADYFPGAGWTAPAAWLLCAALLTAPYVLAARWLPPGPAFGVSSILTALPPLGAAGLCSPLFAGTVFVGFGIAGLLVCLGCMVWIASAPRLSGIAKPLLCVALVAAGSGYFSGRIPPPPPHGWIAVNTDFGRSPDSRESWVSRQIAASEKIALAVNSAPSGSVILTPEDVAGGWSGFSMIVWGPVAAAARERGITVLLGATLPGADGLLSDGYLYLGSHVGRIDARQPIPLGEWMPLGGGRNYRLGWTRFGPDYVGATPVAALICYEQLLVWPAVWSWSAGSPPELLLAPGNFGWSGNRMVHDMERQSAEALARLFFVPVLTAVNTPSGGWR